MKICIQNLAFVTKKCSLLLSPEVYSGNFYIAMQHIKPVLFWLILRSFAIDLQLKDTLAFSGEHMFIQ